MFLIRFGHPIVKSESPANCFKIIAVGRQGKICNKIAEKQYQIGELFAFNTSYR
jgi:hypothetical protein